VTESEELELLVWDTELDDLVTDKEELEDELLVCETELEDLV